MVASAMGNAERQPSAGAAPGRPPETLKKRRDFLAAARARRSVAPGLILQARPRRDGNGEPRVGYTCSKKVGGAIQRNRAKRRLREAARRLIPLKARPGWDYVLIGRAGTTAERSFDELLADLDAALDEVHRRARPRGDAKRPRKAEREG